MAIFQDLWWQPRGVMLPMPMTKRHVHFSVAIADTKTTHSSQGISATKAGRNKHHFITLRQVRTSGRVWRRVKGQQRSQAKLSETELASQEAALVRFCEIEVL